MRPTACDGAVTNQSECSESQASLMAVGRSPEETGDGTSRAGRGPAVRGGARSHFVLRVEVVLSSRVSGWRTVIMSRERAANLLPGGHRRSCGHILCVADKQPFIWVAWSSFWVYSEGPGNGIRSPKGHQGIIALLYR